MQLRLLPHPAPEDAVCTAPLLVKSALFLLSLFPEIKAICAASEVKFWEGRGRGEKYQK